MPRIVNTTIPRCPSCRSLRVKVRHSDTKRDRNDGNRVTRATRYTLCQACGERFVVRAVSEQRDADGVF